MTLIGPAAPEMIIPNETAVTAQQATASPQRRLGSLPRR
jgi:hypothetical protein